MLKKRHIILCFLVFCLTATLLVGVTSSAPYDPWVDGNDDGIIDIVDIVNLAIRFGEEGTPINKTALLLELQGRIDSLNATVEALKTMVQQKGDISVPAAAFVPRLNNLDTRNNGGNLVNYDTVPVTFYAAVQLPDGATVKNFTTYWYDDNASNIQCYLTRRTSTGSFNDMAYGHSSGTPGDGSSYDDTIGFAIVDNGQYGYCIEVMIPQSNSHTDYRFNLAIIEWEY